MSFEITELSIAGAFKVEFPRNSDSRGWFSRVYDSDVFKELSIPEPIWLQQNESYSMEMGTVRGMHFQNEPYTEVKYVRCTSGSILDLLLDTREDSPTFGRAEGIELNQKKSMAILIPRGCAHGFQSLEQNSKIHYLVSSRYNKEHESGFSIYSEALAGLLRLPISNISERDANMPKFSKETR